MKPPQSSDSEMCDVNPESNNSTPSFTPNSSSSSSDIPCQHDSKDSLPDGGHVSHLLLLPPEIIQKICSYIDARFLLNTVSVVCKAFHQLLSQDVTWKIRSSRKCCKQYPVIPVDDSEINWKKVCIEREEKYNFWSNHETAMQHFSLNLGHFAAVDAVHLMQDGDICLSGSRDRSVAIWDLRKLDNWSPSQSTSKVKVKTLENHKGWVWAVTSFNNTLCTASWDCKVKLWDMQAGGVEIQNFSGKSANLCTSFKEHSLIVGSYDKRVTIYDPRANGGPVKFYKYHTRPVLCLVADDNNIVSGSEDKTVVIFDRRAGKIFKKIQMEKFPMTISYNPECQGQIWIGEKTGLLHLMDARDGVFDIVKTYDVGHTGKLTGILHNLGCLVTCSYDKTVKIHEPNDDPETICTLLEHDGEVADIDMQNNVLVSGSSDMTVHVWRPTKSIYNEDTNEACGVSEDAPKLDTELYAPTQSD